MTTETQGDSITDFFKVLKFFIIIFLLFYTEVPYAFAESNSVKVIYDRQNFTLTVNEKPFYIQGAGVGQAFGRRGENYLLMAKELGANAVRTWGIDQSNSKYLDEAKAQGLYVVAGIWLNVPDENKKISYRSGREYMEKKEKEVLDYVRKYKNHPAILMWGLGNEVIAFTKSEAERVAFARFLERLIQKVHTLDPDHPVVYASSGKVDLPYLKNYVPSLDIIGINDYGSVQFVENRWMDLGFDAPYLLTEFGALGSWDLPKDSNGKRIEQSDDSKATQIRNYWRRVRDKRGNNIGGFVFHLGETTQTSLTFYNINDHQYKKEAYLEIQSLYNGQKILNHAPRIKAFKGVPPTIPKGSAFEVELDAADPEGDPLAYSYRVSTAIEDVFQYHVNDELPIRIEGSGNKVTLTAPKKKGVYRIYGFVKDDHGNVSSKNSTLKVV